MLLPAKWVNTHKMMLSLTTRGTKKLKMPRSAKPG
jgi:hypothetical protein